MKESHEKLILRYFRGDLSLEERQRFESWLNESDDNRTMVRDFRNIWEVSNHREEKVDFQAEEEWAKLRQSLDQKTDGWVATRLFPESFVYKIAAAIAFLLVSAFVLYIVVFRTREILHETANQTLHIVLPDSSEVWLNEQSRLVYQDDFIDERSLTLEGEGFFQVKPGREKPFVIHTDEVKVQVIGTSFNVNAYRHNEQTEVFVVTGKVSFSAGDNNSIVLAPGSKGLFNKKSRLVASELEEDLNVSAWRDKRLVFRKTPVGEVVKTLQKYFKTEIHIKNGELMACRFTSEFNDPTLKEVIETLSLALDLEVEFQSDIYSLDGQGCTNN